MKRIAVCLLAALLILAELPASAAEAPDATLPCCAVREYPMGAVVGEAYRYPFISFFDNGYRHEITIYDGENWVPSQTVDFAGLTLGQDGVISGTPTAVPAWDEDITSKDIRVIWYDGENREVASRLFLREDQPHVGEMCVILPEDRLAIPENVPALTFGADVVAGDEPVILQFTAPSVEVTLNDKYFPDERIERECWIYDANGCRCISLWFGGGEDGEGRYYDSSGICTSPGDTYYLYLKNISAYVSPYQVRSIPEETFTVGSADTIVKTAENVTASFAGDTNTQWDVYKIVHHLPLDDLVMFPWGWGWGIGNNVAITPYPVHFGNVAVSADGVRELQTTIRYNNADAEDYSVNEGETVTSVTVYNTLVSYKPLKNTWSRTEVELYVPAGKTVARDEHGVFRDAPAAPDPGDTAEKLLISRVTGGKKWQSAEAALGRTPYEVYYVDTAFEQFPSDGITVSVPTDAAGLKLYLLGEAAPREIPCTVDAANGRVTFTAKERGIYAFLSDALGDVDGDGGITSTDARLVLQYYAKKIDDAKLNISAADVDGDGEITSTDARLILQYYAKKITEFPTKK